MVNLLFVIPGSLLTQQCNWRYDRLRFSVSTRKRDL